ncbi:MAG: TonB-dependent receptor [Hydrogenophaga sp.]|uniref:TonB-dependent receptor family protein n=1 Tax=Hydrogenophaga sp. TaxID=1904254 RepID=UPI002720FE5C|nr:TonB-dependent receptor [Hydrogenophaga sp.]MDO9504349.1 TonB-dependent receptor [Hydrogenophaga sp.]MDP2987500.1 TonB-dependent receptor [Hydrogenophaga sp.]MDP3204665.1 TonB-dependent receptor [Hydrogenophaga sp.]MDP3628733.1 TonB-dependent receptor [Hydrogenophaga sp.]
MHLRTLAFFPLAALPALLHAQNNPVPPETDGGSLAPVIITGSASANDRWLGAATVDVIDGSELRDGQLQVNLSEGLARVPGLVIRNRENYAQDLQVSIRGFGARSTFGVRGVRLFVDGIPASAPDGSGQAANFPLGSADRIEVVRGPFAALYGASSGGAILLYTEDGGRPGELRAGVAAGANGLWRFSTQATGQTGTAETPGWSYALDVGKFATDGARPQSAAHRSTANARLSRAHEGGRTTLVFNRQSAFALDPQGLSRTQWDTDPEQTAIQPLQYNTRKSVSQTQAGLAWDQALGNGHKVELMGYAGQRRVIQFQSIPPVNQIGVAGSSGGVIDLDRDYWGFNARWRLQREWQGGELDLSAGLAGDRQTDLRRGYENFVGTPPNRTLGVLGTLRRDETNRATTLDPYVRASWQRQAWTFEGGLRHVNARYVSSDAFLSNGDQSGGVRFSGYLPVVGARWQLWPQLQAFASVGRGLETPTLNEAAYSVGGAAGLNTALNASRSTSAEVGLRGRNAAGLWNATVFDIRTRDEIVSAGTVDGRASFTNGGSTTRQGLELSAEYGVGNVTVSSAYTYLRARYGSGTASIPAGNRMPGLPEQQLFAQLAWSPAFASRVGGVFTVDARHTGRVFVNDLNSDAAAGHTLFSIGARFEQTTGAWTWREFVRIDNLTDKKHAGSVIVNDGNSRFFEPGLGRSLSAGIELTRRF